MHFSRANNKAIDDAFNAVANISGTTESMLLECLRRYGNQGTANLAAITQQYTRVKAYRKELDDHVADICSKASLPTDKTRHLIALGHVALELENIAELSTTIASQTNLDDNGNYGNVFRPTSSMGRLIRAQLKMAIDAIMATNKQRALQAWLSNADIQEMQMSLQNEHLSLISNHCSTLRAHIMHLSKNLEKIADCSKRISEFAYEITSGQTLCARQTPQHSAPSMQEMAS